VFIWVGAQGSLGENQVEGQAVNKYSQSGF
jgi:hypothetical protein